jgi:hypothetical protein
VVVPRNAPLKSSPAWRIYREIKEAVRSRRATIEDDLEKRSLDAFTYLSVRELFDADERPRLLVETANLRDDGYVHFRSALQLGVKPFLFIDRSRFYDLTADQVFTLRNELRAVWTCKGNSVIAIQHLLSWMKMSTPGTFEDLGKLADTFTGGIAAFISALSQGGRVIYQYSPVVPAIELGRLIIDPRNLPAQIAQGVLEHKDNMKVCANPGCPAPYFLAKRKTQKFCEAGGCVNYGHRKNALDYWHRHKHEITKSNATKKGKKNAKTKTDR